MKDDRFTTVIAAIRRADTGDAGDEPPLGWQAGRVVLADEIAVR